MATDIANLKARRSAIYAQLASLANSSGVPDTTKAGALANTNGGGGEAVDHVGYRKSLYEELTTLNKLIASAEGAFEVTSEVGV